MDFPTSSEKEEREEAAEKLTSTELTLEEAKKALDMSDEEFENFLDYYGF